MYSVLHTSNGSHELAAVEVDDKQTFQCHLELKLRAQSEAPDSPIRSSSFARPWALVAGACASGGAVLGTSHRTDHSLQERGNCFRTRQCCIVRRCASCCERTSYRPQVGWAVIGNCLFFNFFSACSLSVKGVVGCHASYTSVGRSEPTKSESSLPAIKRLMRGDV